MNNEHVKHYAATIAAVVIAMLTIYGLVILGYVTANVVNDIRPGKKPACADRGGIAKVIERRSGETQPPVVECKDGAVVKVR